MSYVRIEGGKKLEGELLLQGSKNAVLPILAAAVLCRGKVVLENCPDISDVRELLYALSLAGVKSRFCEGTLELDTEDAVPYFFGPELAGKTRGGVLLLGAFWGRFWEAGMAYPGGCVIGARPIDLHCKVFRRLGAKLSEEATGVYLCGKPAGGHIVLTYPSVGATENAVLAAVCAKGTTVISGAAREPEVTELCRFLNCAGAKIYGFGTDCIRVDGVSRLHGTDYTVAGDRIVAGTYLGAAAITGGEVRLTGTRNVCMKGIFECFRSLGARVYRDGDAMLLCAPKRLRAIPKLVTAPYPGFPTDMQSQTVAMLSVAEGDSCVVETVFEARFGIVTELRKMGADVTLESRSMQIRGREVLHGAAVDATDLRSGAALVLAGLAAEGETVVAGYEYIARGYEDICGALLKLGALIVHAEENDRKDGEKL